MADLRIGYGPLLPTIAEQLEAQGYAIDPGRAQNFQNLRESIFRLRAAGILVGSQADKCLQRLHNRITDAVQQAVTEQGADDET